MGDSDFGDVGGKLSRAEMEAWRSMRYADGARIERGDRVEVGGVAYRVIGFDLSRCRVLLSGPGGMRLAEPAELERGAR